MDGKGVPKRLISPNLGGNFCLEILSFGVDQRYDVTMHNLKIAKAESSTLYDPKLCKI